MADISDLVGVTLKEVRGMYQGSGEVTLVAEDGYYSEEVDFQLVEGGN